MASSENDVFVCDKCKGSFTSLGYYERHKAKNKCFWRATAYSRVPCPLCSSTFNNDASAERHVRRAHGIFKRKRGKGESGDGDDVECVALKRGKTDERDDDSPALPPSSQLPPHLARLLPSSEQQEGVYGGGGKEEEEEEEGEDANGGGNDDGVLPRAFPCEACSHVSESYEEARDHRRSHARSNVAASGGGGGGGGEGSADGATTEGGFVLVREAHTGLIQRYRYFFPDDLHFADAAYVHVSGTIGEVPPEPSGAQ
jgi:hypothetical protein